jgi:hypothetical protein
MSGTWSTLQNYGPFNGTEAHEPDAMILLSDGSVLVHDVGGSLAGASSWWRLAPSVQGEQGQIFILDFSPFHRRPFHAVIITFCRSNRRSTRRWRP